MRISLGSIDVDDNMRRLIAEHYGDDGLASRGTCRTAIVSNGTGWLDTLDMAAQARERQDAVREPEDRQSWA
jgi:hypothetical protein